MDERLAAWAASGAMTLTGRADRAPLGPPSRLIDGLRVIGDVLRDVTGGVTPDPLLLLGERAATHGYSRRGEVSCSGASRLVRAGDGWLAVTMARPDDIAAVPAWLELPTEPVNHWDAVVDAVATRSCGELVERSTLLGLPVAAVGERAASGRTGPPPFDVLPVVARSYGSVSRPPERAPLVIDLSSLWAGPLCGHLLQLTGARVVKVEASGRPDGARRGPAAFFDLLNGGKESVVVDLAARDGVAALCRLVTAADVVVEASRPRALRQLGIDAHALLSAPEGPRVWVSITGYGRDGDGANRVAFGDDAAAAGGLVVWDGGGPCFCGDAVADPITGAVAAAATLLALRSERRWLLDVAMARATAALAGPAIDATGAPNCAPPRARPVVATARPSGADTEAVLAELAR